MGKGNSQWPQVTTNRIFVEKLEELTERQLKYDFPECQQAEKLGMSGEDRHFMESVSQSVKQTEGHNSIGMPLKDKDGTILNFSFLLNFHFRDLALCTAMKVQ